MEVNFIKTISKSLKTLRKMSGLTQEELVENIGKHNISLRTYITYETGNTDQIPLLEKLIVIANYYHVSLDYLIFGRESTYDNSFTKRDCLNRLSRLIYSCTLIPIKEQDINNPYYGKFYFVNYDPDVAIFMEKLNSLSTVKNIEFNEKGKPILYLLPFYDKIINEIEHLDEYWGPSLERLNFIKEKNEQ